MDLGESRKKIDEIDGQILSLYRKRIAVSDEVAAYKRSRGLPVLDQNREKEKIASLLEQAGEDPFVRQGIEELFEQIMSASRKRQYQRMDKSRFVEELGFAPVEDTAAFGDRVVYQGVPGAYSHQAALSYFNGRQTRFFAVPAWRDALDALEAGRADYAVLPVENSTAGAVSENYDLLMQSEVAVVGSQTLPIRHALLGLPEAALSDIKTVYSHPQALMQCEGWLREHLPEARLVAVSNTAVAAKRVQEEADPTAAAIAGALNAALYGLSLLEEGIQDAAGNETRFVIVSSRRVFTPEAASISLCFALPNESGSLYRILSHFIFNGLNLTRIESRPLPGRAWEYMFFVDLEGNLQEEAVLNALLGVREEASVFKVVGCY